MHSQGLRDLLGHPRHYDVSVPGIVHVNGACRIPDQSGEVNYRTGAPHRRRHFADIGSIAFEQFKAIMAGELGKALLSIHEAVQNSDAIAILEKQVNRVTANVASTADNEYWSVVAHADATEARVPG